MSMGMGQNLSVNQSAQMLPLQRMRHIQQMRVLRLQQQELREYLEQEFEQNPCLELSESTLHPEDAPERKEDRRDEETERFEHLDSMKDDISYYDEEYSHPSRSEQELQGERHQDLMENVPTHPQTLSEYLHEQLPLLSLRPETAEAADRIIYNLDEKGFLSMPLEAIFGTDEAALALGREALCVVQSLDPIGVGAKDLRESLMIQILARKKHPELFDDSDDSDDFNGTDGVNDEAETGDRENWKDCEDGEDGEDRGNSKSSEGGWNVGNAGSRKISRPDYDGMYTLIARYSKELESNSISKIAKNSGMSVEHIYKLLRQLSRLNPNPGRDFTPRSRTITPDIFCTKNIDGTYTVTLEDGDFPEFHIRKQLQKYCKTDAEREFIQRKHNAAKWLLEAIQMRRETLLKIGNALVSAQPGFLEQGPSALKPLTEKQIAEAIGKHPSTVSRAIVGKWMQTPRGLVALADFFSASVIPSQARAFVDASAAPEPLKMSEGSENPGSSKSSEVSGMQESSGNPESSDADVSRDAIQHKLLEIIQNEDKNQPLADDKLGEMLNVARTTINKYRKELKIPSSRERRVYR